jgi:hypothetical protein
LPTARRNCCAHQLFTKSPSLLLSRGTHSSTSAHTNALCCLLRQLLITGLTPLLVHPPLPSSAPCGQLLCQLLVVGPTPRPVLSPPHVLCPRQRLVAACSSTIHLPVNDTFHSQENFHGRLVAASSAGTQLPFFLGTFLAP